MHGSDCGAASIFTNQNCFQHKDTKAVILAALKRHRLPGRWPHRPRFTRPRGSAFLSACDHSPLWFTHGSDCGTASIFTNQNCFQHKDTKAVILAALKRHRLPGRWPHRPRFPRPRGSAFLSACDHSPLWFTHGSDCGTASIFTNQNCFQHKDTKAVILAALKRHRLPGRWPHRPRFTRPRGSAFLSACDHSPLWFTHGSDCGAASIFTNQNCFQHKDTKAVILAALKRHRLPGRWPHRPRFPRPRGSAF